MAKEIEAKFLNINKAAVSVKLEEIGASKAFDERLLRRCVYNLPVTKKGIWVRVRDEVDKVTMTYKRYSAEAVDGINEIELLVDSFDKAREFLKAIGLKEKAYQESKRMRYLLNDVGAEVDIDTWPGLEPWVEIEADSEDKVKHAARLLGFAWTDAEFISADTIYAKVYNVAEEWIYDKCPNISFDNLPKELQEGNRRRSKN